MIEVGWLLVAIVWLAVILTTIFGGLFLRKITNKESGVTVVAKKTARVFFAWALSAKVFVVIALITLGLAFLMMAPHHEIVMIPAGYAYRLEEHGGFHPVPDIYCHPVTLPSGGTKIECSEATHYVPVYRYSLIGREIYSSVPIYWLDPGFVLIGSGLIIVALILACYWMVKANNDWADRYVWMTKE